MSVLQGGRWPGNLPAVGDEAIVRDELARKIGGLIEVQVPFGRADIATETDIFEVEPFSSWTHGVRQVLAYSAQTGLRANIALFGPCSIDRQLAIYMRTRDMPGRTPLTLWFHCADRGWDRITSRRTAIYKRRP